MKNQDTLTTRAEYGTAEMVKEIEELYEGLDPIRNNLFVMRGHKEGIMTFGKSVEEAELRLLNSIQAYLKVKK